MLSRYILLPLVLLLTVTASAQYNLLKIPDTLSSGGCTKSVGCAIKWKTE